MSVKSYIEQIDGVAELRREIAVLRKHGVDYRRDLDPIRQLVAQLHPCLLDLTVSEIIVETPTVTTLRLVGVKGALPPFQAGQYINLLVDIDGIRTSRPYSISSSPCMTGHYDLTVRQLDDGFVSTHLCRDIRVGDTLQASGPAGNFAYNPLLHGKDLVFLAGGSGVTPFMSMIRDATDRNLERRIHLIYGSVRSDDIIFDDALETLCQRSDNLKRFHHRRVDCRSDRRSVGKNRIRVRTGGHVRVLPFGSGSSRVTETANPHGALRPPRGYHCPAGLAGGCDCGPGVFRYH